MRALPVWGWLAAAAVALIIWSVMVTEFGRRLGYKEVRTELIADLSVASDKNNRLLIEYLKARYYYYSNRAGVRLIRGEGDFGYVDESVVEGFSAGKGPTSFRHEYERYRHNLPDGN